MYKEMPVMPAPYNRCKKDKSKEDAYLHPLYFYLFLDNCETHICQFRIVDILYSISRPLLTVGTKVMQA